MEVLNAYRDESVELKSKMDEVYDLAQVGMAIDISDHQFNIHYSQIATVSQEHSHRSWRAPRVLSVEP